MNGGRFRIRAHGARRPSIRVLLLASITTGLLLIMGTGYWLNQQRTLNNMRRLSQETLSTLGDGLRLYVMHLMRIGENSEALQAEIQRIRKSNAHILALRLLPAPVVTRQFALPDGGQAGALASRALASGQAAVDFQRERVIDFAFPFKADGSCLACHHVHIGATLGVLGITLDATNVMQHVRDAQYSTLGLTVAEALLLFLLLVFLLSRLVFTPLSRLQQGAEALSAGSRDVQVEGASSDELGRVIDAFNGMSARLQQTMDGLDQYIREQGAQLGNMVETSRLLGSEDNLDQVLAQMAKVMTESIKITCCRILLLTDGERERLHVRASHPIRPIDHGPSGRACDAAGYPALFAVMEEGQPRLMRPEDVAPSAERDFLFIPGTQWVLCLPVIHRSERFGVVIFNEFRSIEREPMDEKKMRYAMAMTQELAVAIGNIRLNDQLMTQLEEVVFAMAEAVDKKSPWTAGHSRRVADHARGIAEALGWAEAECRDIYRAGLLHDIGKIGTPGVVLNKEEALNADE
ncbi:MAG TPA: HAMP domain-containing protein, partial [Mariprofundaceae bacterium]|nr:HAMP domain-containing protein [Mariprofundaceae bacterium]